MFTGLLIGTSGATAGYTLWLVRRLFTTAPAAEPVDPAAHPQAVHSGPEHTRAAHTEARTAP